MDVVLDKDQNSYMFWLEEPMLLLTTHYITQGPTPAFSNFNYTK
jgi:hypothetical protein